MRIGIDIGGTKIEGVCLDGTERVRCRQRLRTPQGDYQATLTVVAQVVAQLESEVGAECSVGVGSPGARSSSSGLMKNCNSTCLIGHRLHEDLEAALGRNIRLANDADCFALSEAIDGAAAGARSVFGVIVGTGVGGGIVIDRKPVVGPNAIAGEWGHNPMPWPEPIEWPGPVCYCGLTGCIETFLSGPGLSADYRRTFGRELTAKEIASAANSGATDALSVLERYAHRMARALASVINIVDPEVIVLGGGFSNVGFLYRRVPELWTRWVFSDDVATRLVPPKFGDSSGVRGAAWLWP